MRNAKQLSTLALICIFVGIPLGVAGQYVAESLCTLICLYAMIQRGNVGAQFRIASQELFWPTVAALAFCVWQCVATALNPLSKAAPLKPLSGMVDWWLLPLIAAFAVPLLREADPRRLQRAALAVLVIVSLVALSQLIIGWKIEEGTIMAEQKRARGFYSHPLTFAYAFLALLPVAVQNVRLKLRTHDSWLAWTILALVLLLVVSSLSRVAIVVGFGYVALSALSIGLNAKQKKMGLGLALALVVGFVVIPNPIRERMQQSFAAESEDRHTHYADDRLVFWDAHWLMVKERPWTGHGVKLDGAYRKPYYEKLGLGDFEKQYEAHNQWLQTLAETGVIGLVLFILWQVSWTVNLTRRSGLSWWRHPGVQSLLLIGFGGITQNAFQDAEVRFTLTCILAFVPLIVGSVRGNPKSSRVLH